MNRTPYNRMPRKPGRAFTLVELLAVVAVMGVILMFATPAVTSILWSGRNLDQAGQSVEGALAQARAYAMAHNTYTWVGFASDTQNRRLICGAVASKDGAASPANTNLVDAPPAGADECGLVQLGPVVKLPNIELATITADAGKRPAADVQLAGISTSILGFVAGSKADRHAFSGPVIQFNSRGEAKVANGNLKKTIELGLRQTNTPNSPNYYVIQLGTLTGGFKSYRP